MASLGQTKAIKCAVEDSIRIIYFSVSNKVNKVGRHEAKCRQDGQVEPAKPLVDSGLRLLAP